MAAVPHAILHGSIVPRVASNHPFCTRHGHHGGTSRRDAGATTRRTDGSSGYGVSEERQGALYRLRDYIIWIRIKAQRSWQPQRQQLHLLTDSSKAPTG